MASLKWNTTNISKVCLGCFKTYYPKPYHYPKLWEVSLFCSLDCKRRSKSNRLPKFCSTCNSIFYVIPSEYKKLKSCSLICKRGLMSKNYKGSGNPFFQKKHKKSTIKKISKTKTGIPNPYQKGEKSHFWRGGVSEINRNWRSRLLSTLPYRNWRKSVLQRDEYKCQKCGSVDKLHVHHINSFELFPELRLEIDNGQTLCFDCHKKTDTYGRKSIIQKRVNI